MDVAYLTPADLACSAELQKSGTFSGSVKACRQAVKGIRALTGSGGGRMFSSASLRLTSYASSSSGNEKNNKNVSLLFAAFSELKVLQKLQKPMYLL